MGEKSYYKNGRMRMTDKLLKPEEAQIRTFMGTESWERLMRFEAMLAQRYDLNREIRFPFGNHYGWGFRYANKKSLLLYVFFEEGGFCCTISISDKGAPKVEEMLNSLRPEIRELWNNRYPCGESGGWLNRSVVSNEELPDLVRLVAVKVKPNTNLR